MITPGEKSKKKTTTNKHAYVIILLAKIENSTFLYIGA